MLCSDCGADNRSGARFCSTCGQPLALSCMSCGAPAEANDKYCGACGAPLGAQAAGAKPVGQSLEAPRRPTEERRVVSVLFADLVGFTTHSEQRDPEEVRELLTSYFDSARAVMSRYGGTIEKFIGDAIMAVWGTPVATETDPERAVRAGLELTRAVAALGEQANLPGLEARIGVVTGEASVNLAAEGQGMVAGDVVNTAARVQAAADPGTVFVDATTKQASGGAVSYEVAGDFELKGKAEPVELYRATRIVAGRSGVLPASGLEAPFVGRERELRLIKELFHSSSGDHKAHVVSVTGIAGMGKSRLSWELEKYIDGLVSKVLWHRGRCPSYGESVTYWVLSEMVKMRCGITEEEAREPAIAKLNETIDTYVADPEERWFVAPRLAHLLGLEPDGFFERLDLIAGWRLFFERLSGSAPVVLVFEDIQWADGALLDFIEYLLEWSRNYPLFVVMLSRPELAERRPEWGVARRGFTSLFLEPLSQGAIDDLLAGLVPGLLEAVRTGIAERTEGVPLYAVETVRMLLDQSVLTRVGDEYIVTGDVTRLEVPVTLHALIAARLDGLFPGERMLLQDASVAGKSFTKDALRALSGLPEEEMEKHLFALARRELISRQADPMSPERGHYRFLQDTVKQVSYDTMAKKERKSRHLIMASYLDGSSGYGTDEVVEIIASHYLQAYQAAPSAPDAGDIKAHARAALAGAGERASSLGATEEARGYFEGAADLADEAAVKAELFEQAGRMAEMAGDLENARSLMESAIALFESEGLTHPAARTGARLGRVIRLEGNGREAIRRLERSYELLADDEPDEDLAFLVTELGSVLLFVGDYEAAAGPIEAGLDIAESLELPRILSRALMWKSLILEMKGRPAEGLVLLKHSLELALESDLPLAIKVFVNLGYLMGRRDRYEESVAHYDSALALARRLGDRAMEQFALGGSNFSLFVAGRWDEALDRVAQLPEPQLLDLPSLSEVMKETLVHVNRGDFRAGHEILTAGHRLQASDDPQNRADIALARAAMLRAEGDHAGALDAGWEAIEIRACEGFENEVAKCGFVEAVEAAFSIGDLETVRELLALVEGLRPSRIPPFLRAHTARYRARLAMTTRDGLDGVEGAFESAAGMFREIGAPFYLAVALLEHAEWLREQGKPEEALSRLEEARDIFKDLKAQPWLERLDRSVPLSSAPRATPPVTSGSSGSPYGR